MKFLCITLIISLSFLYGKEYQEDFSHTFQVKKGASLKLKNGDGQVNISTWDKDEIKVDVFYHVNSKSSREDDDKVFDVEFRESGDRIFVTGKERNKVHFGFFSIQYIDYRYEISLPAYVNIDVDGDDGDVKIEDLEGNIQMRIDDGDVHLNNIANEFTEIKIKDGDVNINSLKGILYIRADDGNVTLANIETKEGEVSTSDGRIRIRDGKGDFFVDSDDGDISLVNIAGEKLDVKTQDGDVDVLFSGEGEVSIAINSNDGSVDVELDKNISAQFSIETDDGRIRFDVANSDISRESRKYITGDIGEGDGKLKVRTNDGPITISSSY